MNPGNAGCTPFLPDDIAIARIPLVSLELDALPE
jgi:hypothetical protein